MLSESNLNTVGFPIFISGVDYLFTHTLNGCLALPPAHLIANVRALALVVTPSQAKPVLGTVSSCGVRRLDVYR